MNFKVKKEWTTRAGLKATIVLVSPTMPHYCGYVAVDKNNKLYGKPYDDLYNIDVHGGLTFSDKAYWTEDDFYWFGFDAAHAGDARDWEAGKELITTDEEKIQVMKVRVILDRFPIPNDRIKNIDYMIEQCESLAQQLQEKQKE